MIHVRKDLKGPVFLYSVEDLDRFFEEIKKATNKNENAELKGDEPKDSDDTIGDPESNNPDE